MTNIINIRFIGLAAFLFMFNIAGYPQADSVKVYNYLESIKGSQSLLNQFFMSMPKGGDIHNHLSGSVYAETYFSLASRDSFWVNMDNGKLYKTKIEALDDHVPNPLLLSNNMPNLHNTRVKLIDLWSIRNYQPAKAVSAPDEFFFGTFSLFGPITNSHMVDLLMELKRRAALENVQYLEIMATSPKVNLNSIANYADRKKWLSKAIINKSPSLTDSLTVIFNEWEKSADWKKQISAYAGFIDSLDISSSSADVSSPVCLYQTYANRNSDPLSVYAQLYISFKACALPSNKKLVGVNIVSAENSEQSMLYYYGHMKMFEFLKKAIAPEVKTSLHAGELTLGLVKPEDLGSHINEAVRVAKANRIGHGVDIAFENGSASLLNDMKNKHIPVEINLLSNEFILGVSGNNHPFLLYRKAGVPMVISTDDPGIFRTNLAEQYTLLEYRYNVGYYEIKKLVRNSIQYSFAPDVTRKKLMDDVNRKFAEFETT